MPAQASHDRVIDDSRLVDAEVVVDIAARPAQQRLRRQILGRVHNLSARLASVEPPAAAGGPGSEPAA